MLLAGNLPSLVAMQNTYCQRQGNFLKTNNNYWWGKVAQMFVFFFTSYVKKLCRTGTFFYLAV